MTRPLLLLLVLCCAALPAVVQSKTPAEAQKASLKKESPDSPLRMQLARVQILLDRAGFRPGKIDGLVGEFTQKVADRYCAANGLPQGSLLDVSGIPNPYREYTVVEEDKKWIGPQASTPAAQEKLKAMLPGAACAMRRTLSGECSLETRARLERILGPDKPDPALNGDPRVRGAWAMAALARTPQSVAVLYSIANISASTEVREIARMAAIRNSPTAIVDPEPKSSNP